ncbi:amidohydrolase/deacetylase family metallohydrolase [Alloacidobacterium dinghuense]|uniref:Amidohydrolase/deacetylase family metallohydrolase n=1 Tax=Alloacidobacterium dinghuense TaxID=2763107 RepID=A0A7G8BDG8_9BACT|nr:amidohydrolase/deacetylase family metallohydrolase [Alloacidobacterium dinghuense]QNI30588.1 amidohydrolase/deacetylase family metallohydrolase [Alloacidobacterium dinghuense]
MQFGKYCSLAVVAIGTGLVSAGAASAQDYDMILQGGHVLDAKNHVDAVEDVAVKDGLVAEVAPHIDPKKAVKTIDVKGFYVTPGLVDIHVHVYAGTGEKESYAGDNSVYPDGFTFRVGVTTVVDAGGSGWRNFEDFKQRIIDRSKTRVLADLNIVGSGMRGPKYEDNLDDMDGEATGKMALKYPGVVVGIKSAHFTGPEWKPYEQAVIAGNIANIPVMIDYGSRRIERPLYDLLSQKLRPGDIYTHCYSGLRGEQDPETGKASKALLVGRQRGIYFDVGHGGGSFAWTVAIPVMQGGFQPDSISTDLHISSMNAGMKDMLNVADKFLAMGQTIPQVVTEMTWNPAHEVKQDQLGNLSVGAPADIAVLSVEHGKYGFVDMYNTKLMGTQKLICQLTVRGGKVVYDLNGISSDLWNSSPTSDVKLASRWTTFTERPFGGAAHKKFPESTPVK